jgi:hypothetical protein
LRSKEKESSQKLGGKKNSKKGKLYRSYRLTCGTYEAAESSTFKGGRGSKEIGNSQKSEGEKKPRK